MDIKNCKNVVKRHNIFIKIACFFFWKIPKYQKMLTTFNFLSNVGYDDLKVMFIVIIKDAIEKRQLITR